MPDIQRASADNTNQNQARAWDVGVARPMQAAPPRVPTDLELWQQYKGNSNSLLDEGQKADQFADFVRDTRSQGSEMTRAQMTMYGNGAAINGRMVEANESLRTHATDAFLRQVLPGYGLAMNGETRSLEHDAAADVNRTRLLARSDVRDYSDYLNNTERNMLYPTAGLRFEVNGQELDSAATRLNSLRRLWTGLDRHTPVYLP